jgi:outer membrane murein-binding lipoprotein Lpp
VDKGESAMRFDKTFLILAVALATGLLGGCESEEEKTIRKQKAEIQTLSTKLNLCETDPIQVSMTAALTKAKETQFEKDAIEAIKLANEQEIEQKKIRAVTVAAACESFGINLCPSKMTEAGLYWNKKEGVTPEINSQIWWWAIGFKYLTCVFALCILYVGITFVHGWRLKKQIATLAELKREIEENKGLREQMAEEIKNHIASIKEIKEEQNATLNRFDFYLEEARENVAAQEREVEKLDFEIEKLAKKRDDLIADVQQVQDALDAFAPTKKKK